MTEIRVGGEEVESLLTPFYLLYCEFFAPIFDMSTRRSRKKFSFLESGPISPKWHGTRPLHTPYCIAFVAWPSSHREKTRLVRREKQILDSISVLLFNDISYDEFYLLDSSIPVLLI
jgi:hypothetical protein